MGEFGYLIGGEAMVWFMDRECRTSDLRVCLWKADIEEKRDLVVNDFDIEFDGTDSRLQERQLS